MDFTAIRIMRNMLYMKFVSEQYKYNSDEKFDSKEYNIFREKKCCPLYLNV